MTSVQASIQGHNIQKASLYLKVQSHSKILFFTIQVVYTQSNMSTPSGGDKIHNCNGVYSDYVWTKPWLYQVQQNS